MPYLNPLLRSIIHPDLGFVSLGGVEVIAIEVDCNASRTTSTPVAQDDAGRWLDSFLCRRMHENGGYAGKRVGQL